MSYLIAGLVVFFSVHLVPTRPTLRTRLTQSLGENGYKLVFTLVSLVGLGLIIAGKAWAPFVPIWEPVPGARYIAIVVMLPVFILLAGANMPSNLKRYMRHPMLTGIALWSLVHLLANGDLASALLFGSFGIYALVDICSANLRGATKKTEPVARKKDVILVLAGTVAYVVVLLAHPYLFRMPVLY